MSCRPSPTRPVRRPSSDNIDFDYDEFRAERDAALIRYFVQLLWECVKTLLPSDVFHVVRDYTRTFAHTEFYISYPDLYLEWLCHYWAIAAKSRETRISLLLMLFLELTPNWATISMKRPAYTGLFWRILWSQAWRSWLGSDCVHNDRHLTPRCNPTPSPWGQNSPPSGSISGYQHARGSVLRSWTCSGWSHDPGACIWNWVRGHRHFFFVRFFLFNS